MPDTFQEIRESLRRSKLRVFLTGISVSTGIFLLIALLGAGNGIIHALRDAGGFLALDVMMIFGGNTSMPYNGMKEGRPIELDRRDLGAAESCSPGSVRASSGVVMQTGLDLQYGGKSVSRTMNGVSPSYKRMSAGTQRMLAGRFINDLDIRGLRKVIVLTEKDAVHLFGSCENAPGKYVNAGGEMFKVVGVCALIENNDIAYAPYSTVSTVYGKGGKLNSISLLTKGIVSQEDVERYGARFRAAAGQIHQYSPDDKNAVWIYNTNVGNEERNKAFGIMRVALWVIGLLTLISGAVSISNIMLITVRERTREIGIRKALGAPPSAVLRSVIMESVAVTAFFGYAGMALGVLATEYIGAVSGKYTVTVSDFTITLFSDPTVDLSVCIEALAVMVAAGVLAGLAPALKAVKVKPVEALRAE